MEAIQQAATREEYLAFEEGTELKHEFIDGEVFAMSGGTFAHSLIKTNLIGVARPLISSGCLLLDSDMRVKVSDRAYVYPDSSLVCGTPVFEDEKRLSLLNPRVIFEVLSPSSEAWDRGGKFHLYQTIESLEAYVLLSQAQARVEAFFRGDQAWTYRAYGPDGAIEIPGLEGVLPVDALYERVFED